MNDKQVRISFGFITFLIFALLIMSVYLIFSKYLSLL